jgi:Predicted ATPase (AAA+ superfamily)
MKGFVYGKPVVGENFVGRKDILKQIETLIDSGQSVILIGPRRYGKTSLLLEVQRRTKCLIGNVDLFTITTKKELAEGIIETTLLNKRISLKKILDSFRKGFARAMSKVEVKAVIDEFEIVLRAADRSTDEDALLNEALSFPEEFASRAGKRMLFVYDEFGDVLKINGETVKRMRAKLQHHQSVVYIFAGSEENLMENLFTKRSESFYGFGKIIPVGPVRKDAFVPYIVQTYRDLGIRISTNIAGRIVELAGGHPYYVNYLCQTIYLLVKGVKNEIGEEDIRGGYEVSVTNETTYFEKIWFDLRRAPLQARAVRHLARSDVSPYRAFDEGRQNIYGALTSLRHKGIIAELNGKYEFVNPLFKTYLKRI